jgi:hypothetical protein
MTTRNWTKATGGLALAVLATLAVTACDPFLAANKAVPEVIGVMMSDVNLNLYIDDSPECAFPYPEPSKTWADKTWPGVCNPDNLAVGSPTVCPVLCYPPRTGPAFAPFYTGDAAGTYETEAGGTFTYSTSPARVLTGSPIYYEPTADTLAVYSQIRIMFNKLLDGSTIQGAPTPNDPCPRLNTATAPRIFIGTTDVTADFNVCYVPNSEASFWGAQITLTPKAIDEVLGLPILLPNVTYRIVGQVGDQQGNTIDLLVSVSTVDPVIVPVAVRAK